MSKSIDDQIKEQLAAQMGVTVAKEKPKADKGGRVDLLDNKLAHKLGIGITDADKEAFGAHIRKLWHDVFKSDAWHDGDFMDDVRQATLRGAHPASVLMFYMLVAFSIMFFLWAAVAPLDEVSHGQAQVIPTGKIQAVGSPEGGVVEQILVKSGDIVEPGQILVKLNDSTAAAGVGEKATRRDYLQANIIRLQAQVNNTSLTIPADLQQRAPQLVADVTKLYSDSMNEMQSSAQVLREQKEQRQQELNDARRKAASLGQALGLAQKEYDMTKPYLNSGAISKVDILRLERDVVDARKDYNTASSAVPAAEAALREAQSKLEEGTLKITNDSRDELGKLTDEYSRLGQGIKADEGKVDNATLRSPIKAEVKQVLVNTIGQAVQPNANIVELVPVNESLLVEAKIKPSDIAFIRPGLKAKVKITAFDSAIYGDLDGVVENISADSFTDDKPRGPGQLETYFKVQVRTNKNFLQRYGKSLPIKSGMVATVDIVTGRKTVLQYLLKPINKAREMAMTER